MLMLITILQEAKILRDVNHNQDVRMEKVG